MFASFAFLAVAVGVLCAESADEALDKSGDSPAASPPDNTAFDGPEPGTAAERLAKALHDAGGAIGPHPFALYPREQWTGESLERAIERWKTPDGAKEWIAAERQRRLQLHQNAQPPTVPKKTNRDLAAGGTPATPATKGPPAPFAGEPIEPPRQQADPSEGVSEGKSSKVAEPGSDEHASVPVPDVAAILAGMSGGSFRFINADDDANNEQMGVLRRALMSALERTLRGKDGLRDVLPMEELVTATSPAWLEDAVSPELLNAARSSPPLRPTSAVELTANRPPPPVTDVVVETDPETTRSSYADHAADAADSLATTTANLASLREEHIAHSRSSSASLATWLRGRMPRAALTPDVGEFLCRALCGLGSDNATTAGGRILEADALLLVGLPVNAGGRRVATADLAAFFTSAHYRACDVTRAAPRAGALRCPARSNIPLLQAALHMTGVVLPQQPTAVMPLLRSALEMSRADKELASDEADTAFVAAVRRLATHVHVEAAQRLSTRWERRVDVPERSCPAALYMRFTAARTALLGHTTSGGRFFATMLPSPPRALDMEPLLNQNQLDFVEEFAEGRSVSGLRVDAAAAQHMVRAVARWGHDAGVTPRKPARKPPLKWPAGADVRGDADDSEAAMERQTSRSRWAAGSIARVLSGYRLLGNGRQLPLAENDRGLFDRAAQTGVRKFASALGDATYEALVGMGRAHLLTHITALDPQMPVGPAAGSKRHATTALRFFQLALRFRRDQRARQLRSRALATLAARQGAQRNAIPTSAAEALLGIGVALAAGAESVEVPDEQVRRRLVGKYLNASALSGSGAAAYGLAVLLEDRYLSGAVAQSKSQIAWWAWSVDRDGKSNATRRTVSSWPHSGSTAEQEPRPLSATIRGPNDHVRLLMNLAQDRGTWPAYLWALNMSIADAVQRSSPTAFAAGRVSRSRLEHFLSANDGGAGTDELRWVTVPNESAPWDADAAIARHLTVAHCRESLQLLTRITQNDAAPITTRTAAMPRYMADLAFAGRFKPRLTSDAMHRLAATRVYVATGAIVGEDDWEVTPTRPLDGRGRSAPPAGGPAPSPGHRKAVAMGHHTSRWARGSQTALQDHDRQHVLATRWELVRVWTAPHPPLHPGGDASTSPPASWLDEVCQGGDERTTDPLIACGVVSPSPSAANAFVAGVLSEMPSTAEAYCDDAAYAAAVVSLTTQFESTAAWPPLDTAAALLAPAASYYAEPVLSTPKADADQGDATPRWSFVMDAVARWLRRYAFVPVARLATGVLAAGENMVAGAPLRFHRGDNPSVAPNSLFAAALPPKVAAAALFDRVTRLRVANAEGSQRYDASNGAPRSFEPGELAGMADRDDGFDNLEGMRTQPYDRTNSWRRRLSRVGHVRLRADWLAEHSRAAPNDPRAALRAFAEYVACGLAPQGVLAEPHCLLEAAQLLAVRSETAGLPLINLSAAYAVIDAATLRHGGAAAARSVPFLAGVRHAMSDEEQQSLRRASIGHSRSLAPGLRMRRGVRRQVLARVFSPFDGANSLSNESTAVRAVLIEALYLKSLAVVQHLAATRVDESSMPFFEDEDEETDVDDDDEGVDMAQQRAKSRSNGEFDGVVGGDSRGASRGSLDLAAFICFASRMRFEPETSWVAITEEGFDARARFAALHQRLTSRRGSSTARKPWSPSDPNVFRCQHRGFVNLIACARDSLTYAHRSLGNLLLDVAVAVPVPDANGRLGDPDVRRDTATRRQRLASLRAASSSWLERK
jgi:hypothetical protein